MELENIRPQMDGEYALMHLLAEVHPECSSFHGRIYVESFGHLQLGNV